MNRDEALANAWLSAQGFGNLVYEPDGNVPPDFTIDGRIAVEVRRLNQHHYFGARAEGLEQLAVPLWRSLQGAVAAFTKPGNNRSHWVALDYRRPSIDGAKTKDLLRRSLGVFLTGTNRSPARLEINHNLAIDLFPSRVVDGRPFRLAGSLDSDGGGMAVEMYADNLSLCLAEKNQKIKPYLGRYDEWWLLLVDSMGWGLADYEVVELRQCLGPKKEFSRVLLVSEAPTSLLLDY